MLWNDLREYLNRLDELGELKVVRGATWTEDIGGISELMTEREGPALLFDEIVDYPKGYRVASNLFNTPKRNSVALGFPIEASFERLAQRWTDRMQKFSPIQPQQVSGGPFLENIQKGGEVDLYKFPTPQWHENDGGRYIGTGICVIQKDPDTGFVNSGSYRVVIYPNPTINVG